MVAVLPLATTPLKFVVPGPPVTKMRPVPSLEMLKAPKVSWAPPVSSLKIQRLPPQLTAGTPEVVLKVKLLEPPKVTGLPLKMTPPVESVPTCVWATVASMRPPFSCKRLVEPSCLERRSVPCSRMMSPVAVLVEAPAISK